MAQKDLIELVPEDIAPRASLHVAEDKAPKREPPAQVTKTVARTQATSLAPSSKKHSSMAMSVRLRTSCCLMSLFPALRT